jgi:hypothetical protein
MLDSTIHATVIFAAATFVRIEAHSIRASRLVISNHHSGLARRRFAGRRRRRNHGECDDFVCRAATSVPAADRASVRDNASIPRADHGE